MNPSSRHGGLRGRRASTRQVGPRLGLSRQGLSRQGLPHQGLSGQGRFFVLPLLGLVAILGCHQDMYNQPRYEPLEHSDFFADGRAARPLVAGTIPYGPARYDGAARTGRVDGEFVTEIPIAVDRKLLERGRERFNIFCSVCHGAVGEGDGMIVQRGYRRPPTYHSDRLRGVPVGHLYDVITNGYGVMPSYALQTSVADRWAIVAYVRTLQWSQRAPVDELPDALRQRLETAAAAGKGRP